MLAAVAARDLVLLGGVAGAGKSRLLAELTRVRPVPVLAARAFLPERAEAWGLARTVLREALDAALPDLPAHVRAALAVLLPELGDPPVALDAESHRALVLAGGLRLLESAVGEGALLVVDDVQWADPSSLALLGSALARLPLLSAVLAYRPEELSADVLDGLRGARDTVEIALGPLSEAAVAAWSRPISLARCAATTTPFALAEVLRELAARGELVAGADGTWAARDAAALAEAAELGRAGQRSAIRRRAARQTGLCAEVLGLLALLAREAPAQTLATAAGVPPRAVLDALSALTAAGLVRLGERGWATAHDLVAETVTAALAAGERGRLHGLLARAVEAEDADPSETARHHRAAGDVGAAARAYLRAAERALAGHATAEAAVLASAGLALTCSTAPRPQRGPGVGPCGVGGSGGAVAAGPRAAEPSLRRGGRVDGPGRPWRPTCGPRGRGAGRPRRPRRRRRPARRPHRHRARPRAFPAPRPARDAHVRGAGRSAGVGAGRAGARRGGRRPGGPRRRAGDRRGHRHEHRPGRARPRTGRGGARAPTAGSATPRASRGSSTAGRWRRSSTGVSTEGVAGVRPGRTALRRLRGAAPGDHAAVHPWPRARVRRRARRRASAETTAAVRLARELDTAEGQAYALWHRSEALSALGRADEAEADAREALRHAAGHRGWTATGHRALGIALTTRGELDAAAAAFAASAEVAGESLTLFASWAAARRALVALAAGSTVGVAAWVAHALSVGPPLGHYEARLAEVELAEARDDPAADTLAAAARTLAEAGGHRASLAGLDRARK